MGLFEKIFGSKNKIINEDKKDFSWVKLTSIGQLDKILTDSNKKVQAIFKHSTRCGISGMVIRDFESKFDYSEEQVGLYYLDLLTYRDISAEIASRFKVIHESPQFIVIQNGVVVHHSSHSEISPKVLLEFI